MRAAEVYDRKHKIAGKRNGKLGAIGVDVLIELVENEMFTARIAWAKDGKTGLHFAESFDLDRLNTLPARLARRVS